MNNNRSLVISNRCIVTHLQRNIQPVLNPVHNRLQIKSSCGISLCRCNDVSAAEQYEQQLAAYNDLRFMTSAQEVERKRLQKVKLHGKDRMLAILHQYQVTPRSETSTL